MDQRRPPVISTVFGVGYLPWAPGTWMSALLCLLFLFGQHAPPGTYLVNLAVMAIICAYFAGSYCRAVGREDASEVVSDELVGQGLALTPLVYLSFSAPSWVGVLLAFALFRFFDILKPGPVGWVDRNVKGGLGVMLDDLVAGALAALCLCAILLGWERM